MNPLLPVIPKPATFVKSVALPAVALLVNNIADGFEAGDLFFHGLCCVVLSGTHFAGWNFRGSPDRNKIPEFQVRRRRPSRILRFPGRVLNVFREWPARAGGQGIASLPSLAVTIEKTNFAAPKSGGVSPNSSFTSHKQQG